MTRRLLAAGKTPGVVTDPNESSASYSGQILQTARLKQLLSRDPTTREFRALRHVSRLREKFDNWYAVPLLGLGVIPRLTLRLRDGGPVFVVGSKDEYVQTMRVIGETFFGQQYAFLHEGLRPGTVAVDIGAYVGDSAIYLARHPDVSRVIAYEPYPSAYAMARRNVTANGLDHKVDVVNSAVSGQGGQITLTADLTSPSATLMSSPDGRRVGLVTLDEILARIDSPNIILKVDTEGGEFSIFGAKPDLSRVNRIITEYHSMEEGRRDELVGMLRDSGFEAQLRPAIDTVTGYKEFGLILASRPA
jgi:FkbM family methyltransferase